MISNICAKALIIWFSLILLFQIFFIPFFIFSQILISKFQGGATFVLDNLEKKSETNVRNSNDSKTTRQTFEYTCISPKKHLLDSFKICLSQLLFFFPKFQSENKGVAFRNRGN